MFYNRLRLFWINEWTPSERSLVMLKERHLPEFQAAFKPETALENAKAARCSYLQWENRVKMNIYLKLGLTVR